MELLRSNPFELLLQVLKNSRKNWEHCLSIGYLEGSVYALSYCGAQISERFRDFFSYNIHHRERKSKRTRQMSSVLFSLFIKCNVKWASEHLASHSICYTYPAGEKIEGLTGCVWYGCTLCPPPSWPHNQPHTL